MHILHKLFDTTCKGGGFQVRDRAGNKKIVIHKGELAGTWEWDKRRARLYYGNGIGPLSPSWMPTTNNPNYEKMLPRVQKWNEAQMKVQDEYHQPFWDRLAAACITTDLEVNRWNARPANWEILGRPELNDWTFILVATTAVPPHIKERKLYLQAVVDKGSIQGALRKLLPQYEGASFQAHMKTEESVVISKLRKYRKNQMPKANMELAGGEMIRPKGVRYSQIRHFLYLPTKKKEENTHPVWGSIWGSIWDSSTLMKIQSVLAHMKQTQVYLEEVPEFAELCQYTLAQLEELKTVKCWSSRHIISIGDRINREYTALTVAYNDNGNKDLLELAAAQHDLHYNTYNRKVEGCTVLRTRDEYTAEGNIMKHCVAGYWTSLQVLILSIVAADGTRSTAEILPVMRLTAEMTSVLNRLEVRQHRAVSNGQPSHLCQQLLGQWVLANSNK